ncbi:unnamed protein product [Closterium sp. Yama58-4]|nr:unnamed protein product [Closterium sp. Yama58-4]
MVPNLAKSPASLDVVSLRSVGAVVDNTSHVGKAALELYGNPQICDISTGRPLNLSSTSGLFNDSCKWTSAPFCSNQLCFSTQYIDRPTFLNAYPPSNCVPEGGPLTGPLFTPTRGPGACVCVGSNQFYEFDLLCANSTIQAWTDDYSQLVSQKLSAGFAMKLKKCINPEQVREEEMRRISLGQRCIGLARGVHQFYEFDLLCANSSIRACVNR